MMPDYGSFIWIVLAGIFAIGYLAGYTIAKFTIWSNCKDCINRFIPN